MPRERQKREDIQGAERQRAGAQERKRGLTACGTPTPWQAQCCCRDEGTRNRPKPPPRGDDLTHHTKLSKSRAMLSRLHWETGEELKEGRHLLSHLSPHFKTDGEPEWKKTGWCWVELKRPHSAAKRLGREMEMELEGDIWKVFRRKDKENLVRDWNGREKHQRRVWFSSLCNWIDRRWAPRQGAREGVVYRRSLICCWATQIQNSKLASC